MCASGFFLDGVFLPRIPSLNFMVLVFTLSTLCPTERTDEFISSFKINDYGQLRVFYSMHVACWSYPLKLRRFFCLYSTPLDSHWMRHGSSTQPRLLVSFFLFLSYVVKFSLHQLHRTHIIPFFYALWIYNHIYIYVYGVLADSHYLERLKLISLYIWAVEG